MASILPRLPGVRLLNESKFETNPLTCALI